MVAALAMAVRRPVKYIMSRKEDMLAATPAPQAVVDLKTGMTRNGKLTALKSRVVYDSGAFPGAPMLPGCLLIGGYYKCENLDIQGYEVLTNKVSVGALRAPRAHNVTFAIESHMDMMARELGLEPIEVRLKNAAGDGERDDRRHADGAVRGHECRQQDDVYRGARGQAGGGRRPAADAGNRRQALRSGAGGAGDGGWCGATQWVGGKDADFSAARPVEHELRRAVPNGCGSRGDYNAQDGARLHGPSGGGRS